MAIIQINTIDSQPFQTLLTRLLHIFRITPPHNPLAILGHLIGEFRSQEDLIPFPCPFEPFPNQILVIGVEICTVPIHFAEFVGTVEHFETLFIGFGAPVEGGEAHGAETESRDLGAIAAELAGGKLRGCHCWCGV